MIVERDRVLVLGYQGGNPEGRVIEVDKHGFVRVQVEARGQAYRHPDTLQKVKVLDRE